MDAQYEEALETRRQQLAEQAQGLASDAAAAAEVAATQLTPQDGVNGAPGQSAAAAADTHDPQARPDACCTLPDR